MTATRQFLVTMSAQPDETLSADRMANRIAGVLLASPQVCMLGMVEREMTVIPLPDLAADDSDLQTGFRAMVQSLREWDRMNEICGFSAPIALSRGQMAALVAELSKQHPARTSQVDYAALDAMRAIRESDKHPGRQVQKDARAQLIITDAICRCVPEQLEPPVQRREPPPRDQREIG